MKLPSPIRIGPYDISLSFHEREVVVDDEGEECWAFYRQNQHHIMIWEGLIASRYKWLLADTLLHEIQHVIWRLGHLQEGDEEERVVSVTATSLTQVFRDNPELRPWVFPDE